MRSFPGGPRVRVAFLIGVAVGVFFLPAWWMVAAVGVAMAAAWLGLRATGLTFYDDEVARSFGLDPEDALVLMVVVLGV